jgi:hypothetical protein
MNTAVVGPARARAGRAHVRGGPRAAGRRAAGEAPRDRRLGAEDGTGERATRASREALVLVRWQLVRRAWAAGAQRRWWAVLPVLPASQDAAKPSPCNQSAISAGTWFVVVQGCLFAFDTTHGVHAPPDQGQTSYQHHWLPSLRTLPREFSEPSSLRNKWMQSTQGAEGVSTKRGKRLGYSRMPRDHGQPKREEAFRRRRDAVHLLLL